MQKSTDTTTSPKKVYLKSAETWDDWSQAFEGHSHLYWDIITGHEPPLRKQATLTLEGTFPNLLLQGEVPGEVPFATLYLRLTATQRASFDGLKKAWNAEHDDYKTQEAGLQNIRNWVVDHVSPDVQKRCCPSGQPLSVWWTNLQAFFARSAAQINIDVNRKYRDVLSTPMERESAISWVQNWEDAMTRIDARGVALLQDPSFWLSELSDAVLPAYPIWAEGADKHLGPLLAGNLSWMDIARDLRRHIVKSSKGGGEERSRKRHPQAGFPADYNKEDNSQRYRGKKRVRSPSPSSTRGKCYICEKQGHGIRECWYGPASGNAPDGWKPSPATMGRAKGNLKKPFLRERVDKVAKEIAARKRTKLPASPQEN